MTAVRAEHVDFGPSQAGEARAEPAPGHLTERQRNQDPRRGITVPALDVLARPLTIYESRCQTRGVCDQEAS